MDALNVTCDMIPQQNLEIPSYLLKKSTGDLNHTTYWNGGICEFDNKYFLAYRTEQEPVCTNPRLHIVELDRKLLPIPETNVTLDCVATKQCWRVDYAGKCHKNHQLRAEDPRLCAVGDTLYIVWTDGFKIYYSALVLQYGQEIKGIKRLSSALLLNQHIPKPPWIPELSKNKNYDGRTKNWSPFRHNNKLHVIYSYEPFITCRLDGAKTFDVVKYDVKLDWKWGFVKGGSQAVVLDKERYVTFFHSSMRHTKVYEDQGPIFYYMGAITFNRETLAPMEISRYPILAPYPEDNGPQIVFPAGVIDKGDHFIISYGYNDRCTKLTAYPKDSLDYNLRPVELIVLDEEE